MTANHHNILKQRIHILNIVVVIGFLIVGVGLLYWSAFRAESILARDDNPRLVDDETSIQRGKILSTNDLVLAESREIDGLLQRIYQAKSGGQSVGHYSIRYGTAGIEDSLDPILRGQSDNNWVDYLNNELLHMPQIGQNVRLTIDERWQRATDELMDNKKGAALLLSIPDVSIRALSSQPSYDPNTLDEQFDDLSDDENAPLLNRVSQGQYQPGLILQPFLLAYAQEQNLIDVSDPILEMELSRPITNDLSDCSEEVLESGSWVDVLQESCLGPMVAVGNEMGNQGIEEALNAFHMLQPPDTELPVDPEPADFEIGDPGLAAIGQDFLRVSPLQVGLAWVSLANAGEYKNARLVEAIQDLDGNWQSFDQTQSIGQTVTSTTARNIRELIPENRGVTEHTAAVLSSTEGTSETWYLALVPASNPIYAVVVVLEDSADTSEVEQIGRSLIRNVFSQDDS